MYLIRCLFRAVSARTTTPQTVSAVQYSVIASIVMVLAAAGYRIVLGRLDASIAMLNF